MTSLNPSLRPATLCIHAGTHLDAATGGACSPIFTSTAFAYPNASNENVYPRYFNVPNQVGISDGLVRVSVGVEDIADLEEDFGQALGD